MSFAFIMLYKLLLVYFHISGARNPDICIHNFKFSYVPLVCSGANHLVSSSFLICEDEDENPFLIGLL